jgi:error-prone DNA polymerase
MALLAEEVAHACGGGPAEARRLLDVTGTLADSLALDPYADLGFGSVRMPEPGLLTAAPPRAELRARCRAGIGRRYPGASESTLREVHERLDQELALIGRLGYESYFLTVAEVVGLTRELGVRCAARGSGAGSLVNHLLGVSGVDPVRYGLLMERFLSERRTSLPDIDLDVESARRTEVYDRILERFGRERTLCVSMMETYRVRHAVRDVGAALGLPPEEIDTVAKSFPHIRAREVRAALRELPELRSAKLDEGVFGVLFDLVEKLDGLPRHIALHPSGVLLGDRTLRDLTPVEASFQGYPMSQFDKDDVEELGLLKLDVLGVRMQSAMAHALAELERTEGRAPDLDAAPLDDPETFELIRSTRTLGCFQIESPGQRELLGKFGPETFEDLIVDISLFRPGPVKSDMVTPFLNARQGWSTPEYPHERLRPVLAETEGVVVFHEQVIRTIAVFTGCELSRADEARRALGSSEGQLAVRDWFCLAAERNGFDRPAIQRVWEILHAFASFGFCKAHAAAFALPTYQSAWLKTHHPAAFYAGVLTHDPGMYPKRLILDDARHFGVRILPPDVNASQAHYTVEDGALRIGLADVRGLSESETRRLLAAREAASGGPYTSLTDFRDRAQPSRPTLENLVLAGALDTLHPGLTRRDLLFHAAQGEPAPSGPGQLALAEEPLPPPALPAPTPAERVRGELAVLGLDHSAHLLTAYEELLDELGVTRARDLLTVRNRAEILVAGVKVATQTPPVRSGKRVVFATLDDATGPVDLALFEDAQERYAATVFHSWLLLVRGVLRRTGPRGVSLTATGAWDLDALRERRQTDGLSAVQEELARTVPTPAGRGPQRVLVHPSGFRVSPYADLRPPGEPAKDAPRKLWHTSPGSPG